MKLILTRQDALTRVLQEIGDASLRSMARDDEQFQQANLKFVDSFTGRGALVATVAEAAADAVGLTIDERKTVFFMLYQECHDPPGEAGRKVI